MKSQWVRIEEYLICFDKISAFKLFEKEGNKYLRIDYADSYIIATLTPEGYAQVNKFLREEFPKNTEIIKILDE